MLSTTPTMAIGPLTGAGAVRLGNATSGSSCLQVGLAAERTGRGSDGEGRGLSDQLQRSSPSPRSQAAPSTRPARPADGGSGVAGHCCGHRDRGRHRLNEIDRIRRTAIAVTTPAGTTVAGTARDCVAPPAVVPASRLAWPTEPVGAVTVKVAALTDQPQRSTPSRWSQAAPSTRPARPS